MSTFVTDRITQTPFHSFEKGNVQIVQILPN